MWVPLIENNEFDSPGADYFVEKNMKNLLSQSDQIDTIILGCTHYPLMMDKIRKYAPPGIRLMAQGEIVANSLKDYLQRHPEMEMLCTKTGSRTFYTTETEQNSSDKVSLFYGSAAVVRHLDL